jgi:hypothetical protein
MMGSLWYQNYHHARLAQRNKKPPGFNSKAGEQKSNLLITLKGALCDHPGGALSRLPVNCGGKCLAGGVTPLPTTKSTNGLKI